MDPLDRDFLALLGRIRDAHGRLPRPLQVRVERWCAALAAEAVWRATRNNYAKLLARAVQHGGGGLHEPPFAALPPPGPLPALPPHATLCLRPRPERGAAAIAGTADAQQQQQQQQQRGSAWDDILAAFRVHADVAGAAQQPAARRRPPLPPPPSAPDVAGAATAATAADAGDGGDAAATIARLQADAAALRQQVAALQRQLRDARASASAREDALRADFVRQLDEARREYARQLGDAEWRRASELGRPVREAAAAAAAAGEVGSARDVPAADAAAAEYGDGDGDGDFGRGVLSRSPLLAAAEESSDGGYDYSGEVDDNDDGDSDVLLQKPAAVTAAATGSDATFVLDVSAVSDSTAAATPARPQRRPPAPAAALQPQRQPPGTPFFSFAVSPATPGTAARGRGAGGGGGGESRLPAWAVFGGDGDDDAEAASPDDEDVDDDGWAGQL